MKLKNYIKKQSNVTETLTTAFNEVSNEFRPVIDKVQKPVRAFGKKKPKTVFIIMLIVLLGNIGAVMYYNHKHPQGSPVFDFTSLQFPHKAETYEGKAITVPNIDVSFANIQKARVLKDTLQYLMQLKHMTYQDTVTFVRVVDEFNALTGGKDSAVPPITIEQLRQMKTRPASANNTESNTSNPK